MAAATLCALSSTAQGAARPEATERPPEDVRLSYGGVFQGSTPCDGAIRRLLYIPHDAPADVIEWELKLAGGPIIADGAVREEPARYELRFEYGPTAPGQPGLAPGARSVSQQGGWTVETLEPNPEAIVIELEGSVSLRRLGPDLLHVLDADRRLLVGNGGWSYTLNKTDRAEPRIDPALQAEQVERSYRLTPLATGPDVYGVFEGRTPCQGLARELQIAVDPACTKAKWRVTLRHDPQTQAPTTYRVEGAFYPRGPREGRWTIGGALRPERGATVFRLEPSATEPAIVLWKGDDNVLFFIDAFGRPRVGNRDHSYTLDRRSQGRSAER